MELACRYYSQKFPEVGELVLASVRSVEETSAYIDLTEYNGIEGMISLRDITRLPIRSINKLLHVGSSQVLVVTRVDKQKGYIDLSKRHFSEKVIKKAEGKFARAKCINSILRRVAEILHYKTNQDLENLYWKTAWYFDRKLKKQNASYEVFKHAWTDASVLDECSLDEKTRNILVKQIKHRFIPQILTIRAEMNVTCYGYEGIDAVKDALRAGLSLSTKSFPIRINLIATPTYVMTTRSVKRTDGLRLLQNALRLIKKTIEKHDGLFSIQMTPQVLSMTEEMALAQRFTQPQWNESVTALNYNLERRVHVPQTNEDSHMRQLRRPLQP